MADFHNPLARKEGLVIQEVSEEVLVYDTMTHKAHCLNVTAAFVWKLCDGKHSVNDISKMMGLELGAKVPDDLVWMAIDQLEKDGLLDAASASRTWKISRREVMRKLGMASVVALPVIASLVAPNSAAAGVNSACACINPGGCFTQTGCPSLVNCNGSGICAP